MSNVAYTAEQRKQALKTYRRTKSVTKTIRILGYPGRWTLHKWIRQQGQRPKKPFRHTRLKHYPFETKLQAVKLFDEGHSPAAIAEQLQLNSKMSVYSWHQRYREQGQWGLMSSKERKKKAGFTTKAQLEASMPDDITELKKLAARLTVEKAVLAQELEEIKKDDSAIPGALSNKAKTRVVMACQDNYPLPMLLEAAGLSASTFYYQQQRLQQPDKYAELRQRIDAIATESGNTYGYRRIHEQLCQSGTKASEKVVRRIMKEDAIEVRYARCKRRYSSYQGEISKAPANVVQRNFHADAPGKLWVTDISEFSCDDGKVYISAIIDCFDGKIVGLTSGFHPTQELVDASLHQAFAENPPADPSRLVIHSDRGVHYRSRCWLDAG